MVGHAQTSQCVNTVAEGHLAKKEVIAGFGLEVGITRCVSGCADGGEASRGVCGWGIKPNLDSNCCLQSI